MEQAIEKLCEKFGVTANYLVDELCRYCTTMDKISLVVWVCILILTSLVIIVGRRKDWFDIWDSWGSIVLLIVILIIGVSAIVFIPYAIVDLVGWHLSPISKTIELLTR